jgi:hypothetical protein
MDHQKQRFTPEGKQILTITPKPAPGGAKPDASKPPPFASSKPQPAGQIPVKK